MLSLSLARSLSLSRCLSLALSLSRARALSPSLYLSARGLYPLGHACSEQRFAPPSLRACRATANDCACRTPSLPHRPSLALRSLRFTTRVGLVSGRHPNVALVSGLAGVMLLATKNGCRLLPTHMRYALAGKHACVRVRARMRERWQTHRLVAWFAPVGARGSIVRLDWRVGRAATASACWAELAPRRSLTSHHHPPPTSPATRARRLSYLNYSKAGRVVAMRAAASAADARRPRPRRRLGRAQACGEPSDAQRRSRKAVAASRSPARAAMAARQAW